MLELISKAGALAVLGALALGCSSNGTEKSTGSNWLACTDDGDCAVVTGATCGQDGYCVDDSGARISRLPDGTGGTGGAGTGGAGGATSCDVLEASRDAELETIQRCTSDAECGQVLTGTSCGCTRNLVARNDADVTAFYEIGDQMTAAGCDSLGGTCDCPEADGFACEAGRCTWNYLVATPCQSVAPARLCVHGTGSGNGETLEAGDPLRVELIPEGCWSSSCTTVDVASCSVTGSGTTLSVEGQFCLGGTGADVCTADCGGGRSAVCGDDVILEEGDYTVTLGTLGVSFTVPSTLDFGGVCDGSPF